MTLRQRRDLLRDEVSQLLDTVSAYRIDYPATLSDNPFIAELESRLKEKTAELESLNHRVDTHRYRFWEASHAMLLPIWLSFAGVLLALFFTCSIGIPWLQGCNLLALILSLAWSIWATLPYGGPCP